MEEAARISYEEHGSRKLAVISGVGTRHYYAKLGYHLDGPYMSRDLREEDFPFVDVSWKVPEGSQIKLDEVKKASDFVKHAGENL